MSRSRHGVVALIARWEEWRAVRVMRRRMWNVVPVDAPASSIRVLPAPVYDWAQDPMYANDPR